MPIKKTIIDLGYKAFIKDIKQLKHNPDTEIGIFDRKKRIGMPFNNVTLMAIHEFGVGVPQRSPIRGATDNNKMEVMNIIVEKYKNKTKLLTILDYVGDFMYEEITKRFGNKRYLLRNAPLTIMKKGFDAPLIETGELKSKVEYKVRKKTKE